VSNTDLKQIAENVQRDLDSQIIGGKVLLDRLLFIDENSRRTSAYLDHKYAPFYYYLGKYINPKNVLEIGFNLGLLPCCLMLSCKSVNNFLGLSKYKNDRLGKKNIKNVLKNNFNVYSGRLYDNEFIDLLDKNNWDLAIINDETTYDEHLNYLDFLWGKMSENAFIVCEHLESHKPSKEAFLAFSESKSRECKIFNTRYGTGILQR
jgi:hypothetical protein